MRLKRAPSCHPDRPRHSGDLCKSCYDKLRSKDIDVIIKRKESQKRYRKSEKGRSKIRSNRRCYNEYYTNRRKTNITFKLSHTLRRRLNNALKNNQKRGSAVADLGCTIDFLKQHLEALFQPGMSWDNHGKDGWHIDHIKPLSSFNLTDPEQLKEACHYTNLQPLWAIDNILKSNKY